MLRTPLISSDQPRAEDDDESESRYACDCGQEYTREEHLQRHQQTNCKNRSIKCSFCQENCSSSAALRDHLLLCGNKTDQCPKCRQFIRRSHFAYHYENNCAAVDEVETPPTRSKNPSTQQYPPNSNKPVSRQDVSSDDYQENYPGPRVNGRVQSPISNTRGSPVIIECEYCHSRCAQNDYKTHKDNCLRNPANNINKQTPRIPLRSNQNQARSPVNGHGASNGIVHIPCEICNEPVDLPNWSNHLQNCREREARRLAMRARSMSQEPVTEQLPCEYCRELYPANRLHLHQKDCTKNPGNAASAANVARARPAAVQLPIKISNNNRSNQTSPTHYQSIDIDRTHEANRLRNNNEPVNQLDNSPRGARRYENVPVRPNDRRPNEIISPANRSVGRKSDASSRLRSSLDGLQDFREDQGLNDAAIDNRSPYYNGSEYRQRLHKTDNQLIVINNQPDRLTVKKKKKSSMWKRFFCGTDNGYSTD